MPPKTKLELTWIGKENRPACACPHADRPKLEPRILLETLEASYHIHLLCQASCTGNLQATSRCRLDDLFHSMLHRAFQGEL
jgi:hypothetical protein